MPRINANLMLSMGACVALAFAPAAFAGHGHGQHRGGYGGHRGGESHVYRGGGRYDRDNRRYYGDRYRHYDGDRYYRGGRYYHRDHAGRWIAGALITGAVVGLIANAIAPPPTVYYPTQRRTVYATGTVYDAPGDTRYVGPDDDYDQ